MNKNNENNVLVTGGCGFIGSHLVKSLINEENTNVINVDCLTYAANLKVFENIKKSNYTHINHDLSNKDLLVDVLRKYKPNKIFHLAAETHVDRSIDGPSTFIKTNIVGTFNVLASSYDYWSSLESSEKKNFRVIYTSTDEVYGSIQNGLSSETDSLNPNSPYSASKASADMLVRSWNKTYDLPTLITRCSNNYGSWQFPEKLIPLCIQKILNNDEIPVYGNGLQIRDWIHVGDHIDALIKLSKSDQVNFGESYNIGAENEKTNLEIIHRISSVLDVVIPKKVGSYDQLVSFVEDRPGHDQRYALSNKKIRNTIEWSPKISFDEGITETVKWYVENSSNFFSSKGAIYDGSRIGILGKKR